MATQTGSSSAEAIGGEPRSVYYSNDVQGQKMMPKITDDDNATISVTVNDEIKMSWVYADDGDRQEKMRHAHYWCDGYMAGAGALLKHVGQ